MLGLRMGFLQQSQLFFHLGETAGGGIEFLRHQTGHKLKQGGMERGVFLTRMDVLEKIFGPQPGRGNECQR